MKNSLFISAEAGGRAISAIDRLLPLICKKMDEKNFDVSEYSDDMTDIGIIINCFPDDLMAAGFGKPRIKLRYADGTADIRLPMPYVDFINADDDVRLLMMVKNITESVKIIGERCRKSRRAGFDSEGMITEILSRMGINKEELDGIQGVMPQS